MPARLSAWLRSGDALDLAIALVALAVVLLEVQGSPTGRLAVAFHPWLYVLYALQTLPLAIRRRAPIAVFLVVALSDFAVALPLAPPRLDLPAASYIALQIANYTLNAHAPRAVAIAGVVAIIVGFIGVPLSRGEVISDLGWIGVAFIVPTVAVALAGSYIRDRRVAAAYHEARARALEAERDENAGRAAATERARIARELHDVVAHSLSVMVVQAGAARRIVRDDPSKAHEALRSIEVTGRDALAELRRLLGVLRRDERERTELAPQPGLARIGELAERTREAGLAVDLSVDLDGKALSPGADLSAYRVVQEALTNALRHARASRVAVRVQADADGVVIEVADDGTGAAATPLDGAGTGLIGMRERVEFFGGEIRAGPRAEGGYTVWARFPLETA